MSQRTIEIVLRRIVVVENFFVIVDRAHGGRRQTGSPGLQKQSQML